MSVPVQDSERVAPLHWDIFCRVIDNWGDIGVCWRLASALAQRGQQVRLWADDASALAWMAPDGYPGVQVMAWQPQAPMPAHTEPGDVVMEAFGCNIDHAWIAMNLIAPCAMRMPATGLKRLKKSPVWLNLEYLSAESYVQRSHGLPSPIMSGPATGMTTWFYYPGFTSGTGGLMREPQPALPHRAASGSATRFAQVPRRISLFCYEPPALAALLDQLAHAVQRSELWVLPGRGQQALEAETSSKNRLCPAWNMRKALSIKEQSMLSQPQYDALLASCSLNFVRGEDSLVRALLAGRALVWQIYPQADGAHAAKLEAFLDWLQAPPDLRLFHRLWNGLQSGALPQLRIQAWAACVQAARTRLLGQRDLVSQLLDFVEEKRNAPVPSSA